MMLALTPSAPTDDSAAAQHTRLSPRLSIVKKEKKTKHSLHGSSLTSTDETHSMEDITGGKVVSSSYYWQHDHDPVSIDGKLRRMRHYLHSARALYELQYQSKRPNAMLKMKSNSFGFKTRSTFDPLAALISPLRSPQILDHWSGLEISIYEEAFEHYGKDFHAIAQLLPNKSVKDVIAFYYVWKKHSYVSLSSKSEAKESESAESQSEPEVELTGETRQLANKLQQRQACLDTYLSACRELHVSAIPIAQRSNKRVALADFGLHRLSAVLQPSIPNTSPLRTPSCIDEWTPYEIRVFEAALECYGKEFDQVARMIQTKTCRQVISFYYLWKKEAHYQQLKNGWEANRDPNCSITPTTKLITTTTPLNAPPLITTPTHSM